MAAKKSKRQPGELPMLGIETRAAWSRWLSSHHASSQGIWRRLAKKGAAKKFVTYAEAVASGRMKPAGLAEIERAKQDDGCLARLHS